MVHKGMLESLVTLDVRKLESWQLDEVQAIWRDFRDRKFQPFYTGSCQSSDMQLSPISWATSVPIMQSACNLGVTQSP